MQPTADPRTLTVFHDSNLTSRGHTRPRHRWLILISLDGNPLAYLSQWLAFLLQPVMVTLAIIIAVRRRTITWVLLAGACVSHMCIYNTRFVAASAFRLLHGDKAKVQIGSWAYDTARAFHILFLLLIISAFIAFLRERPGNATPTI